MMPIKQPARWWRVREVGYVILRVYVEIKDFKNIVDGMSFLGLDEKYQQWGQSKKTLTVEIPCNTFKRGNRAKQ